MLNRNFSGLERSNSQEGHDAPILGRAQDRLQRWSVANSIFRDIKSSPITHSTRFGLYGEWGVGKTSITNLIQELAREQGDIIISLSAWKVVNLEDFLQSLHEEISSAIKSRGAKTSWKQKIRSGSRTASEHTQAIANVTGQAASKFDNTIGASVVLGSAFIESMMKTINHRLKLDEKEIENLRSLLAADHRVFVFIDDIDRSDPIALPKILLSLREILDLPGFSFILAFDRFIVDSALEEYSKTYSLQKSEKLSSSFLDKIIDQSISVSRPPKKLIAEFVIREITETCEFIPNEEIVRAAEWFPSNPRQAKAIVRELKSFRSSGLRHDPSDLSWEAIMLQLILRKLTPGTAEYAENRLLGKDAPYKALAFSDKAKNTSEFFFAEAMSASNLTRGSEPYKEIELLLTKIQGLRSWQDLGRIQYEMDLPLIEPILTAKEYRRARDEWHESFSETQLIQLLELRAEKAFCEPREVLRELFLHAFDEYVSEAERIDRCVTLIEQKRVINQAEVVLGFICDLYNLDESYRPKGLFDDFLIAQKISNTLILHACREFVVDELLMRVQEKWLFNRLTHAKVSVSELYYFGNKKLRSLNETGRSEGALDIAKKIVAAGLECAADEVLKLFFVESGLRLLKTRTRQIGNDLDLDKLQFIAGANSPLYSEPYRKQIENILALEPTHESYLVVASNLYECLTAICADISNGTEFFTVHRELLQAMWDFTVRSGLRKEHGLDWLHYQLTRLIPKTDNYEFKFS